MKARLWFDPLQKETAINKPISKDSAKAASLPHPVPAPGRQAPNPNPVPASRSSLPRIAGYDLSRAIAVFGMLVINFDAFVESVLDQPGWLSFLLDWIEGRAAATFVLLAGVGISLGARRFGPDPLLAGQAWSFRRQLARRAILIFIIGMLFSLTWEADILHYYGVFLLIGALFIGASGRILMHAAFFGINFFVLLFLLFEFETGWDWETVTYVDFWSLPGMLRHLFFNGCYPVFPWVGFLLIGMWLGRRDLTTASVRSSCWAAVWDSWSWRRSCPNLPA